VLRQKGFSFAEIRYGFYRETEYRDLLARARAMIFLAEHESQGSACQECLSTGVPILAWDQGWWLDPSMARWRQPQTPASSVPYFDERCGLTFRNIGEFEPTLNEFTDLLNSHRFAPREYVLKNLTIENCARRYLEILDEVAKER
jgi:glycosyltransferase involved in cell wall biosynthesis